MPKFDTIVIGLGGMGSAVLYHLASRGQRVLGIEQFRTGHDRGSSHGRTRLIRRAYFEHPSYIPLVNPAYSMWADLEQACGRKLLHRSGLVLIGAPDGPLIEGVQRAAREHALDIHAIDASDLPDRFPAFLPDDDMRTLWEPDAGYLAVEDCVLAHLQQAQAAGAVIREDEPVRRWRADGEGVVVETDTGRFAADNLVLCGGPWTNRLLRDGKLALSVRRKVVLWFDIHDNSLRADHGCPVFCFDTADGFFYGFPATDSDGLKVGEHSGGEEIADPDRLDRSLHPHDTDRVCGFVQRHLSGVDLTPHSHSVCMYTMTPDEHFVVDRHPRFANVFLAAGFSGHGFKFAPVIGSVMADLVTAGRTDTPIGFLSALRSDLRL